MLKEKLEINEEYISNEFYKDKSCMKYTQTWEELLGDDE